MNFLEFRLLPKSNDQVFSGKEGNVRNKGSHMKTEAEMKYCSPYFLGKALQIHRMR